MVSSSVTDALDLKSGSTVNVVGMTTPQASAPNHHAHYPHFAGATGLVAAVTMISGRSDNARLAATLSGLQPHDIVIDIGCGPGAAARLAARLGASVTGVDPATVMLRVARLLTRSSRVRYVEGTAETVPLADECASVVWTIASVHHWADVDAGLREIRRLLRPGGTFVAIENHTRSGAQGLASHGWTDGQATRFADMCR